MPTSMLVNHFPQNLFDILIGGLYSSVHLGTISSWILMSDLKLLTYLYHHVTTDIRTVMRNDGFWHSKSTYQIVANKISHHFLGYRVVWSCFHPLGEVINGNQNECVPLEASGSIGPMTSMPQATNGQGELLALSSWGGTQIKSPCTWHFCTNMQQSFSIVIQKYSARRIFLYKVIPFICVPQTSACIYSMSFVPSTTLTHLRRPKYGVLL